ncbi:MULTISPECIES: NAD(P)H-hydrate dehydratase [unclassified Microbacterium]|uniref:NAD(P)H-hydrate dehydratase n=1 Tax=unclassified Microbacterium TaxID=2609290 RepID=UPI000CFDC3B0|nr:MULTISPECIES: NAD(P)H-hydrate dehydratase [unclassified Microbacterium]PQZ53349.1 NAD(P)H-hydrate dehydratase [Microbacterium sp. MYb43]PQZ75037.1 NAD(P)H-hydrate dehydratase [Microbacterium sp. MYb40]PRB19361.1 NAD(P)H-hydrate dehydratase [Microbacterium sp. MYb54]PRB24562.1 NAD(P)H-hydrate dehydratase [Microbacterium sp. MYb50]PRB63407.1 NAD(P)H-hydrate dehydratase [Microbacterium sp. MYb24]
MFEVHEWTRGDTARLFRAPTVDDDKYARGVVALRTGSPAYPGAAVLGVEAAWRTGAGFVRYVGAERVADAVLARRPETVVGADAGRSRVDAWVIGSGTDPTHRSEAESSALREVLSGTASVVIDAGALDLAEGTTAPFLVTPHAWEFARLQEKLGVSLTEEDRAQAARHMAGALGGTVLLKGARTLIAAPDGTVIAVDAGTGWLATAGTGDVLAGVLGAVLAANPASPIAEVAAAGAWVHGHAGRIAAGMRDGGAGHPIVAMDVAEALPYAVADVLA